MTNKFAEIARKECVLSAIMDGKTKISTEDVIKKYPNGITITGFDVISLDNGEVNSAFPVLIFKENPAECFFGGALLTKIVAEWVAVCGDVESASNELAESGGVRIKMTAGKTKAGKNITKIDIIG